VLLGRRLSAWGYRSIREPKVGKPHPRSPAPGRGFFNAPASSAAFRNFRLYNRIRPEAADTRQIDVGALPRERDATGWVPSSESRIWNKPGDPRKGTCREIVSSEGGELSLCVRTVVMSKGNDYRQQVEEAAARVE
jgi:hypothetical protein